METASQSYDLIGDIHGHGRKLIQLLEKLGYQDLGTGYAHPQNKVIFLGDFIDRGEDLVEHDLLMTLVMKMVRNGHALAVMGNHEFNALAYHTEHEGKALRAHSAKNQKQHQAFLNEFDHNPERKAEILDFFWTLPIFLEFKNLRVVHACWADEHVDVVKQSIPDGRLTKTHLIEASTKGAVLYDAIETLLKGIEITLPKGVTFLDKDRHERDAVRIQWWKTNVKQLKDIALPVNIVLGEAGNYSLPEVGYHQYSPDEPPCFIGHYWMQGQPQPLSDNVACLDYSVARGGDLVAYRWGGERVLQTSNFCSV